MLGYGRVFAIVFGLLFFAGVASAVVVTNSPARCSGGFGWFNCKAAFASGGNYAFAVLNSSRVVVTNWEYYGFNMSLGSRISRVRVRVDAFGNGTASLLVRATWNANDFGPRHPVSLNSSQATSFVDVTNDTSWTPLKLRDHKLKVSARCFSPSNESVTCGLDWVPVEVTYQPPQ